ANVDNGMTQGMNLGILTLLGVIGTVLASIGAFIFFLIRRSAKLAALAAVQAQPVETISKL
ncbi:MAG TPA: hypothetical protein VF607_15405, partial [Verrucomicrobiae bacterium]